MADYLTPQQSATRYLTYLKSLKPEINTENQDSDWWIRAQVHGGVVSGLFADQRKIAEDAFPQSARREALERHLQLYFGTGFRAAQSSVGSVKITGTTGSILPSGTELVYEPNGNTYTTNEELILVGASGEVPVTSVGVGQAQNLFEGTALTITSPPAGIDGIAVVYGDALSDGRDEETNDEAAARILDRVRQPTAGGTETDYRQYALAADPAVTSASVIRYIYGLGTVGVVITSGTTDIDAAIDEGLPIVRTPSADLINTVREYIETLAPVTDCVYVVGPTERSVDVEVEVSFVDGFTGATIDTETGLTLLGLVEREVRRAVYKTPIGGRKVGNVGYLLASEIEEVIDAALSASPYTEGNIALALRDRRVLDLGATSRNLEITGTEILVPNTITVTEVLL